MRAEFTPIAKNRRTVYISGIGHGSPTVYTGHLGDHILEVGAYQPAEVANKSIHLLSCQTAKQLGPDMVTHATRSYDGYFENFTFVYDNPATPVDEMNLFWIADSTWDQIMVVGGTADSAYQATLAMYTLCAFQVPNTAAAVWLTYDRNYMRAPTVDAKYGKKDATVSPWMFVPFNPFLEVEEALPQLISTRQIGAEIVHAATT